MDRFILNIDLWPDDVLALVGSVRLDVERSSQGVLGILYNAQTALYRSLAEAVAEERASDVGSGRYSPGYNRAYKAAYDDAMDAIVGNTIDVERIREPAS